MHDFSSMLTLFSIKTHFSHFCMWLRAGPGSWCSVPTHLTFPDALYMVPPESGALSSGFLPQLELRAACSSGNCRPSPSQGGILCPLVPVRLQIVPLRGIYLLRQPLKIRLWLNEQAVFSSVFWDSTVPCFVCRRNGLS